MLGDQLQTDEVFPVDSGILPTIVTSEKRDSALRSSISFKVFLRPASTSQRHSHILTGKTKNTSQSGFCVLTDIPALVGDVYRLQTPNDIDSPIDGVVARCVRCQMIDEELFESGFQFFSSIQSGLDVTSSLQNPCVELM